MKTDKIKKILKDSEQLEYSELDFLVETLHKDRATYYNKQKKNMIQKIGKKKFSELQKKADRLEKEVKINIPRTALLYYDFSTGGLEVEEMDESYIYENELYEYVLGDEASAKIKHDVKKLKKEVDSFYKELEKVSKQKDVDIDELKRFLGV
jgi:hypothetical protein